MPNVFTAPSCQVQQPTGTQSQPGVLRCRWATRSRAALSENRADVNPAQGQYSLSYAEALWRLARPRNAEHPSGARSAGSTRRGSSPAAGPSCRVERPGAGRRADNRRNEPVAALSMPGATWTWKARRAAGWRLPGFRAAGTRWGLPQGAGQDGLPCFAKSNGTSTRSCRSALQLGNALAASGNLIVRWQLSPGAGDQTRSCRGAQQPPECAARPRAILERGGELSPALEINPISPRRTAIWASLARPWAVC